MRRYTRLILALLIACGIAVVARAGQRQTTCERLAITTVGGIQATSSRQFCYQGLRDERERIGVELEATVVLRGSPSALCLAGLLTGPQCSGVQPRELIRGR